jgi:3-dehydroquinate dehydratase-1/3-dehydroquinate dehydratase/shikimate dehydrogenase
MMNDTKRHRICVSIGRRDALKAIEAAQGIAPLADVIEIRLDCIERPSIPFFLSAIRTPLLFTNRPTWEGGCYAGQEDSRLDLLVEAMQGGAAYIDLELQAPAASLARIRIESAGAETKLILSRHDFHKTPPREELSGWLQAMRDNGADIGKIVTTAQDYHDVLRVLQLQEEAAALNFPLIAFCMGKSGTISRLATLELGGYMTYCALDTKEATAPGQISVADLRSIYALLHREEEDNTLKESGKGKERI